MMTDSAIALGGNLGEVRQTLLRAIEQLQKLAAPGSLRASRIYRTRPMGNQAGGDYLNAVVRMTVELDPEVLWTEMQRIEEEQGRVRTQHWGPRTIDLDLLSWGDQTYVSAQLQVPHPGCWYRRFVLDPWEDVAADWRHPDLGETVREMRNRLQQRPLRIGLSHVGTAGRHALEERLRHEFQERILILTGTESSAAEIRFSHQTDEPPQRRVLLADVADPVQRAVEVVQAALDEPVVEES